MAKPLLCPASPTGLRSPASSSSSEAASRGPARRPSGPGSWDGKQGGRVPECAVGPNPTDRGKPGTTRHLVVHRRGTSLAFVLTGANAHDSTVFEALVDAAPRSASGADGPGNALRSSTPTRGTTTRGVARRWAAAGSTCGSPAGAPSRRSVRAGTAGWSSGGCRGGAPFGGCACATSVGSTSTRRWSGSDARSSHGGRSEVLLAGLSRIVITVTLAIASGPIATEETPGLAEVSLARPNRP